MSVPKLPVITITPVPTSEELAAIVAAVTASLGESTREDTRLADAASPTGGASTHASRWGKQGRADAMRGLDRAGEAGNAPSPDSR